MNINDYREKVKIIQYVFRTFYPNESKYHLIEAEGIKRVTEDFINSLQVQDPINSDDNTDIKQESEDNVAFEQDSNLFEIQRKLVGAEVVNEKNGDKGYISESFVKRFGLSDGDIVSGCFNADETFYLDKIETSPSNETLFEKKTMEFKYGIVERNEVTGKLFVRKNINGDRLSNVVSFSEYIIPDTVVQDYDITVDDTADLIWWKNDPSTTIKVRWINHPQENTSGIDEAHKKSNSNEVASPEKVKVQLEYDLENKLVGIIIGDKLRAENFTDLVESHNGRAKVIDAFAKQDVIRYYSNQLNDCDLVVFVQNLNKHSTQSAMKEYLKDNPNVGYAIANSAGIQTIERAIYRALNHLPAQETGQITYPLSKK